MVTIEGKHNTALCFTDELEPTAFGQIKALKQRRAMLTPITVA